MRRGLIAGGDPEVGALVTTSCASLLVVTITAFTLGDGIDVRGCLPFFAIGMLVPGASQILFIQAVRRAGAARATVVIGVTPLASVAIAHVFLDEHVGALTVAGTSLIVLGGVALASERARPAQFRLLGGAFALVCVAAFAVRDNLVRAVAGDTPVFQAIAASLLGAATMVALYLVVVRRDRLRTGWRRTVRAFAPAGLAIGVAYSCLVIGLDRGRVSLVAPLSATQSLFAVVFAAMVFHDERLTRRTVLAGVLVVIGGAIIGATR